MKPFWRDLLARVLLVLVEELVRFWLGRMP